MDPALMFGMVSEHDEEEDETFDLSGWMSRSAPDLGSPMINEPTIRPRGGGPSDNVMASASIAAAPEPEFNYRPRSNSPNLGYTIGTSGKFQTAVNPLYAHDESKILGFTNLGLDGGLSPKIIAGVKTAALAGIAANMLWRRGRPSRTLGTVATMAYLHPVLGWNHGYLLPNKDNIGWNLLKGTVHLGALYGAYKFIRK